MAEKPDNYIVKTKLFTMAEEAQEAEKYIDRHLKSGKFTSGANYIHLTRDVDTPAFMPGRKHHSNAYFTTFKTVLS